MASKTEQFKAAGSNLGRTIGQSWSMITGKDVANYSLLFLDETLTRKRGEHETIFMPHIVLGRSSRCHVRYGDQFGTVSREHASITVDGSNFVINHNPVASNPTYVNGRAIGASHFLQNGDEIQLSSNGPKMRFNTSALKTSTIGLTMSQAVKPYKTALWIMGLLLLGSLAFSGWNMYSFAKAEKEYQNQIIAVNEKVEKGEITIAEAQKQIEDLINKPSNTRIINHYIKQDLDKDGIVDSNDKCPDEYGPIRCDGCPSCDTPVPAPGDDRDGDGVLNANDDCPDKSGPASNKGCPLQEPPSNSCKDLTEKEISKILPNNDVVVIIGKRIEVKYMGKTDEIGVKEFYAFKSPTQLEDRSGLTIGTGFLTENGRLLTCRHVVQPWRYYKTSGEKSDFWKQLNIIEANGGEVVMHFDVLTSEGSQFMAFTSKGADMSDATDKIDIGGKKKVKIEIFGKDSKIDIPNLEDKTKVPTDRFSDWANIAAEKDGTIQLLKDKSTKIEQGEKLYVLGFSHGLSLQDVNRRAEASLATTMVANSATINGEIVTSGANYGPGNSGGPAFICVNGSFYCVGIVSAIVGGSNSIIVPVGRVRGSK